MHNTGKHLLEHHPDNGIALYEATCACFWKPVTINLASCMPSRLPLLPSHNLHGG